MAEDTIIEYDDKNDMWRTVREDGIYFFFEDGYAINEEDRRVGVVYEIVNGKVSKVFDKGSIDDIRNNGFNIFNDLVVERSTQGWEDGVEIVENVEAEGSKKCKAIETGEVIENDEYCYSEKGLCVVKNTFTDTEVNDNNCMYGDKETYFYTVGNSLYMVNKNTYQKINSEGLYVIDGENKAYSNKKEGQAKAYSCSGEECTIADDLESQYYYNVANDEVLYYNSESGTWKKIKDDNQDYFFNKYGRPVNEGEEVIYAMYKSFRRVFVSKSNPSKDVLVKYEYNEMEIQWNYVVQDLPSCKVEDGVIKSTKKMNVGDYLVDDGKIVIIRKVQELEKRQEGEEEYTYEVVVSDSDKNVFKYVYNESTNEILILNQNGVDAMNVEDKEIEGKIILDKATSSPITSTEPVDGIVYSCDKKKCTDMSDSKFTEGKDYVSMYGKYKLLEYVGGQWKIEEEPGYYFFNEKGDTVELNGAPMYAYEVYQKNGEITQESIINSNIVGFFLNKASDNKFIINNNNKYYSKGMKMHDCNVTVVEDGILCKSKNETVTYEKGDYCYKSSTKQIYLLLDEANYTDEEANCIYGTNEEPKYIESSEFGKKINGTDVSDRLIEISGNAIRLAKPGYYIVDGNYTLTDNNDDEEHPVTIYNCSDTKCEEVSSLEEEKIVTGDGTMYEMDEDGKLVKVSKDGIYFFDANGSVCVEEDCVISKIVKIEEGVSQALELDELEEGAYVNAGDTSSVAIYKDKAWSIASVGCTYVEQTNSCSNQSIDLNVGSYCVVEGKIYVIYEVKEDVMKCIPGDNEKPLFITNEEGSLLKIKEKSVEDVSAEGYYVFNVNSYVALESVEAVKSKMVHCDGDECANVQPAIGRYLNRAPEVLNIAQFEDVKEGMAKAVSKSCTASGGKCSATEGSLVAGDVCIDSGSLYLVDSGNSCYAVDKNVVSYQLVSGKLYMLNDDTVIQLFDGYYFLDKDNHAIESKADYSKAGVKGYMCSVIGECFDVQPIRGHLYPDYTTKKENRFDVLKYGSSKSKRDGGSGYESLTEEGIFKLDDGSYVECEFNNNDEITCKDIDTVGSYMSDVDKETGEGVLINCTKNEEGEVECIQATKGGYYVIDEELMLCTPNEDKNELVCVEMDKEGYFITNSNGELYSCVEKKEKEADTASISSIYDKLNAIIATYEEEEEVPEMIEEEVVTDDLSIEARDGEEAQNEGAEQPEGQEDAEGGEGQGEGENGGENEGENEGQEEIREVKPEPKEVECAIIKCEEEDQIIELAVEADGDEQTMYVCVKSEKPGQEENEGGNEEENSEEMKWVAKGECECLVKLGEYYKCDEDMEDLEIEVPKPNTDHTSTVNTEPVEQPTTTKPSDEPTSTTKSDSDATSTTKKEDDKTDASTPPITGTGTKPTTTATTTKTSTTGKSTATTTGVTGDYYMVKNEDNNNLLYHCKTKNEACIKVIESGYYINAVDDYYMCFEENNELKCSKSDDSIDKSISCDKTDDIGKLFLDSKDQINICLDNSNSVLVKKEMDGSDGNYIITKNTNNKIFKIDSNYNYGIIKISERSVMKNKDFNNEKYLYVNNNEKINYKILNKGVDTCSRNANSGEINIVEFKCDNGECNKT